MAQLDVKQSIDVSHLTGSSGAISFSGKILRRVESRARVGLAPVCAAD